MDSQGLFFQVYDDGGHGGHGGHDGHDGDMDDMECSMKVLKF
jgi:hypothetical protein